MICSCSINVSKTKASVHTSTELTIKTPLVGTEIDQIDLYVFLLQCEVNLTVKFILNLLYTYRIKHLRCYYDQINTLKWKNKNKIPISKVQVFSKKIFRSRHSVISHYFHHKQADVHRLLFSLSLQCISYKNKIKKKKRKYVNEQKHGPLIPWYSAWTQNVTKNRKMTLDPWHFR